MNILRMQVLGHTLRRLFILVAVTVSLVATGFQNRMPTEDDAALQAYVLAGGDPGDLCVDPAGDGLPGHGDCPVCHIVATVTLPASNLTLHDADLALVAKVSRESLAVRNVPDPACGIRAPPLA